MDDVRVQWVGDRLQSALGVKDGAPFEELLNRNDGDEAEILLRFLNLGASAEEGEPAALFFRQEIRLDEVDVEIGGQGASGRVQRASPPPPRFEQGPLRESPRAPALQIF